MATAVIAAACGNIQTNAQGGVRKDGEIIRRRDAEILAGWTASFQEFVRAAHTQNWLSPGLPATLVQPQLGTTVVALWLFQGTKTVIVGDNSVVRSKIEKTWGQKATIVVCTRGDLSEVDRSSAGASPKDGAKAKFAQYTATLVHTSVGWKVETQTMRDSCPAG
jgi:hypothetical protein